MASIDNTSAYRGHVTALEIGTDRHFTDILQHLPQFFFSIYQLMGSINRVLRRDLKKIWKELPCDKNDTMK
jgi:hypothetical protein